jgi:hypothetical protein
MFKCNIDLAFEVQYKFTYLYAAAPANGTVGRRAIILELPREWHINKVSSILHDGCSLVQTATLLESKGALK